MVTSVGNNTTSILTLFRTGTDGAADANSETLAKIQQLAKEAEQLKAGSSPAQLQGASVATNAWIGSQEFAPLSTGEIKEVYAAAARAREFYRNPQATDVTGTGISRSAYEANFEINATSVGSLVSEIAIYNSSLSEVNDFDSKINYWLSAFERMNTPYIRSIASVDIRSMEVAFVKGLDRDIISAQTRVKESPAAFEKGIEYIKSKYIVDGELAEKDDNGRYYLGKFTVSASSDYMIFKSDGNGHLFVNTTEVIGEDRWEEIYAGDDRLWKS